MKKLFIVESPGKSKTIKKYLGNDFTVLFTMGHIKDLPQKKLGIEFDDKDILITYEPIEGKEKIIKELKKSISQADEIYLAPDADREGEIIAYHINQFVHENKKNSKKKVYRVTYNEISKKAILEGIKNSRNIDENMVCAQQARRILDRLVGYKVSPVLWRKISKGLSAGRVQSVALKLICERENQIKDFKQEEYWSIHGKIKDYDITADITDKSFKKKTDTTSKEADRIFALLSDAKWIVTDVKNKERKRKAYAPFTTSTLQQASYTNLHFNVQQTMMYAQQLYEGIPLKDEGAPTALITYMRTDSTRISDDAIKAVRQYIGNVIGNEYVPKKKNEYFSKKKNVQDAHEAIRPIDVSVTPESIRQYLSRELYLLYELIWNRFVASQMADALYSTRNIIIEDKNKSIIGKTSGSIIIFPGFLKVYRQKDSADDYQESKLPPSLDIGSSVNLDDYSKKQHFTQPPARFSEATLVKELEEKKIGRPSTYVPILRTIRNRLYTELDDKKRFVSTKLGFNVYQVLQDNMTKIMDYSFTAKMELELDQIAQGSYTRDTLVKNFYDYLMPAVQDFLTKKLKKEYEKTGISCSLCKKNLLVKGGKLGDFIGCEGYPDCKYTANFKRDPEKGIIIIDNKEDIVAENELLDVECEKCQKKMVVKQGRFGEFTACSGYPKCNFILQKKTKSFCPECNKSALSKKMWKGRVFWGCSSYPKCKFAINSNIIEQVCKYCQYPFLKKDYECANKECMKKNED